jgi:hypothetical protein
MRHFRYLHRASPWRRLFRSSNLDQRERVVSLLVGVGLAALGMRRWKSPAAAMALGGLLLRRGLTGSCPVYRRLGVSSA